VTFELSPELTSLRAEVRAFLETHVLPAEDAVLKEDERRSYETLHALQAKAKAAGLFVPHLPAEYGGRGLGIMGMCVLFREMGRSPVGARVFNCDAPDQGNMDLLLHAGSEEQKAAWLVPLANAEITSAFSMTEPAPGAGADPTNLRTVARRDGTDFVIDGHKWYATGGGDASFYLLMARTSDDPKTGATIFVVDRKTPGIEHVRDIPTMGGDILQHREAELRFRDVRVPETSVLGGIGQGFKLAQLRLVPARLTHCMRWLGLASRTLELCKRYVIERVSFGKRLAEHQMIQLMIAKNASAIHAGNLMTYHCATMIEAGKRDEARTYSSMAKVHVAQTLLQTLDDAIQMHGSLGYSEDVPFSRWYRHARAARIADGPDEVHTMVIARDFLKGRFELLV
jgi:acyl-CoA dehydrogenase